ncbi:MAG: NAD(P)H-binding protein [Dehalococcoidia bacterium]
MTESELNVITGAFGYTGRYITERLLSQGRRVRTLTGHADRPDPFGGRVEAVPFNFENPPALVDSLRGATTLFNTYWVRFSHGETTFDEAVANTKTLIRAAEEAGVRRIVHVSITNADEDSPLPYFRGKGVLERVIAESKLSYAIVRPTVIFGKEDILINNIAWLLRRFPVFTVLGSGEYRLQPVYVEDMADMAVAAAERDGNETFDAVGPETFTFDALVRLIRERIGSRARIVHIPPGPALRLSRVVGLLVRDVVLTQEEVVGLMAGLLVSSAPPTGRTRLSDWLGENAAVVGARYASELERHYR